MVALAKVFFSKLHRFQTLRGVSFEQHIFREGLYLQETGYPAVLFPNDKDNFVESRNWICQISQHLVFFRRKTHGFSGCSVRLHISCRRASESGRVGDARRFTETAQKDLEKTHSILYAVSVDVIYRCHIIFYMFC